MNKGLRKGDLVELEHYWDWKTHRISENVVEKNMIQYTGEKRPPREGEYFISGGPPAGFLAVHDMSNVYLIGRKVRARYTTTITTKVLVI